MLDSEREHFCQPDSPQATDVCKKAEVPFCCPICCDHTIERVEGIVLSARAMGGRDLSEVSIYRCARWHLFATFKQPKAWE